VQRCNELELGDAPVAEVIPEPGPPPLAEGGQIADGTYFHTAEIAYNAPSGLAGPFGRARIEIAGSVWQEVSGFPPPDTVNPDKRSTGTLSLSGTKLTLQRTCPSAGSSESGEFTAASDHFTLFVVDHGTTFAAVFTKQ
jgi:hypothetical protein